MRKSDWTSIYWDKGRPYVRITPVMVEMEKYSFPHGISVSTLPFDDEAEAIKYANIVDKFFDAVRNSIIEENKDQLVGY